MSLADLVTVNITANTASPTRPGFGTPLVAAYHTYYADRVRAYSSASAMLGDGFTASDPAYLAVSAMFAQNPSPAKVKVGRRANKPAQSVSLTVGTGGTAAGTVFAITGVGTPGNLQAPITYTVGTGATPGAVATAIAALVTGHGASAAGSGAAVVITPNTGTLVDIQGWNCSAGQEQFALADGTPDPGITADLNAIWAVDMDWYGLALDSNSPAEITSAAAFAETNKRLFLTNSSDTACTTSSTLDIMSTQKALANTHTGIWYNGKQLLCYMGAAMLGELLPLNPGSWTAAYKTVAGVPVDDLTTLSATGWGNVVGKNGNVYFPIAGLNTTFPGISPAKEYLDIADGIDWLQATLQVDIFGAIKALKKVPFTDAGVDVIRNVVVNDLQTATDPNGAAFLVPGSTAFNAPLVANVSATDRGNRNLPGCTFSGNLAGAIHTLTLNGTLTV